MQEINVIGLDLAKTIFYVYEVNRQGLPAAGRPSGGQPFAQAQATAGLLCAITAVPGRYGSVRNKSLLGA